jgi:hypothetical protein
MQTMPALPDPRQYAALAHPLNLLVRDLMAQRDLGRIVSSEAAVDAKIIQLLHCADDQALDSALAGAATLTESRLLQERLQNVLRNAALGEAQYTVPFAIPLVLVAGSRGDVLIPGELGNIETFKQLLITHGIVEADTDVFLSRHLVERDALLNIKASQLLQWCTTTQFAADGLPMPTEPSAIKLKGDGVFLRYIVGAAIQRADQSPAIKLNAAPGAWSIALTKWLGEQLQQAGLTLFPLPRAPQTWLAAIQDGRIAQQEIRFQVFVSNTLRELRQKGETPVAVLSTHENGELRVTIGAERNGEEWAGFVWPLNAQDHIESIQQMMVELLHECHHQDIRVIAEVLPTVKDNLPYFPLPSELPASTTQH